MPYTLWSKGRLLGHTDFGFVANTDHTKMGWFHPTELGEQVMEVMTEPSRVVMGYREHRDIDSIRTDLLAAGDRIEALELELRSPEGVLMDAKDIGINDTQRLLALAADLDIDDDTDYTASLDDLNEAVLHDLEALRFDDMDDDIEAMELEPEPWEEEPEFPRYQILVFL